MQLHEIRMFNKNKAVSCRTPCAIYEATIETKTGKHTYVGLTGNEFKDRYYQHKHDYKDETKKDQTELAKHIWKLKKTNI